MLPDVPGAGCVGLMVSGAGVHCHAAGSSESRIWPIRPARPRSMPDTCERYLGTYLFDDLNAGSDDDCLASLDK